MNEISTEDYLGKIIVFNTNKTNRYTLFRIKLT